MTRRRHEHGRWDDVLITAAAVLSLLIGWWAWEASDPETPAPIPQQAPDMSDRREVAQLSASRSGQRVAPAAPSHARGDAHHDASGRSEDAGKLTRPVVGQTLQCIRWHESRGDYQAFNGIEHYGAYQLSATYSDDWAHKYGYGQWANVTADQWPPSVQDAVAAALFADWPGAWSTLGSCT